jgi:hypothetical protein
MSSWIIPFQPKMSRDASDRPDGNIIAPTGRLKGGIAWKYSPAARRDGPNLIWINEQSSGHASLADKAKLPTRTERVSGFAPARVVMKFAAGRTYREDETPFDGGNDRHAVGRIARRPGRGVAIGA